MFGQAYRLIRATAAVVHGVTRQVCKILPENSVVVLEGRSDDGRRVNVRCGTERLWMFARDWMDRCRSLSLSGVEPLPAGLKLLTAATADSNNSRSEKATIDAFKENIRIIAGHKIHDAVIWKFAHYKSDTQWKRWKSGRLDLASSAARTFSQILAMPPVEFVEELKKQQSKTSLEKFF